MTELREEVTTLLIAWSSGDPAALSRLMPLVEEELRRIARRYMQGERPDHTLQSTALVHELYLKLVDQRQVSWQNRAHFFGCCANLMRRLLVDHARKRQARKRCQGIKPLPLEEAWDTPGEQDQEILALHDALEALEKLDERQSRIVELHFFGGLTFQEIGEILKVSVRTVKRDWKTAKLWLRHEIAPS